MLRRLLLWLLLIGLTPAGPELVEWAVHFAREGDFVHATDARHRQPLSQQEEHGCPLICHACRCHGPSSAVRRIPNPTAVAVGHRTQARLADHRLRSQASPEPQVPPPIA